MKKDIGNNVNTEKWDSIRYNSIYPGVLISIGIKRGGRVVLIFAKTSPWIKVNNSDANTHIYTRAFLVAAMHFYSICISFLCSYVIVLR